jgi:hypothetical protein
MQNLYRAEILPSLTAERTGVASSIRLRRRQAAFLITGVVVGNVQYPSDVANAVSRKLAATQDL